MNDIDLNALAWPADRLEEALELLARKAGLARAPADPAMGGWFQGNPQPQELDGWIQGRAARLGLDAEPVSESFSDLDALLTRAGPALLQVTVVPEPGFVLLLSGKARRLRVIDPGRRVRSISCKALWASLGSDGEKAVAAELQELLIKAGVPERRRERALRFMARERFGGPTKTPCWLLRTPPEADFGRQLAQARLPQRLMGSLAVFAILYGLEISAWNLMGKAALDGRFDGGWFGAWTLLVFTLVPLELLGTWLNASFALDAGRLLKQRMLTGILNMDFERIRRRGSGQLLGRVMESQALESLALSGGLSVLLASVELAFAAWILSQGLGGMAQVFSLLAWLALALLLGWRYVRRLRRWTDQRLGLTHELIERMVGHRSCLVQEPEARRVHGQDRDLDEFLEVSKSMDRAAVPLSELIVRGWLLLGIAGLVPGFAAEAMTPVSLGIGVGGVLLAARAFSAISAGLTALARAIIAWERIAELFPLSALALRPASAAPAGPRREDAAPIVLDAQGLVFRHPSQEEPILRGGDLRLRRGDRLLLEGPSGGGKSTLASILVGLREAGAGLLLLNGLDRPSLGAAWRRHAAAAPQFHENHILSGSLAFNLLMGRGWPAGEADLAEAEALCRELGLGELLDRMPSGLMTLVGETGWQLSHGERSRVFLARALLQKADLTVLDESFAALDPESLRQCLDCALNRTETLLVIAHP